MTAGGAPRSLDRRLHAVRPDLADIRLRQRVEAARYVTGEPATVTAAVAPLRRAPDSGASLDSEALFGESATVFERRPDGWAWVQLADGYVGWMPSAALGPELAPATHRVSALRTFLLTGPDLKLPASVALSLGSLLRVTGEAETRGTRYLLLAGGGAVFAGHVAPAGTTAADPVAVAERLLGTPYLWGGRSSLGLDCSGLVQLALAEAGVTAPRDTDLQEAALGTPVAGAAGGALRRGDLVFWPGHVGMMQNAADLIHANGFAMAVASESLAVATARIAQSGAFVSSVRRLAFALAGTKPAAG